MISVEPAIQRSHLTTAARSLSILTAALMLSACAGQTPELSQSARLTAPQPASVPDGTGLANSELQKATAYWGQEFAKQPAKVENAVNYAKNLKALGERRKALAVLEQASRLHSTHPELASEYGRLALEFDQIGVAERMLAVADQPAKPDWRVISARGTVLAKKGQYSEAIPYYERALALSAGQPSVLNNLAMAHAMKGDAQQAESLLRQAAAKPQSNERVNQNLALVLGLQGRYDEARSTATATAADTDVIRQIVNLDPIESPATVRARAVAQAQQKQTTAANAAPPALKPALAHDTSAASPWQTTVAANDRAGPEIGLKGAAR
jgi:Flp pilus assembly protein TadD